jgi:hypothetical protein
VASCAISCNDDAGIILPLPTASKGNRGFSTASTEGFSRVLKLSVDQIHLLVSIQGDVQQMSSALADAVRSFEIAFEDLNRTINELVREAVNVSVVQDRLIIFGRLEERLADWSAGNSFTEPQKQQLENDYLSLRSWASLGIHEVFHATLPDLPIGGAQSGVAQAPLAEARALVVVLETNTNTQAYLPNLLIQFMCQIGVLPPWGTPILPNAQAYADAAPTYSRWTRRAMPIWRPGAVEADKQAIRNIVWQGLHLSGAANLVRLNHNLFAFLAHASKRARKGLLGGELATAFAERFSHPNVQTVLADAMRDLGVLGPQKWNTRIFFTTDWIQPPPHGPRPGHDRPHRPPGPPGPQPGEPWYPPEFRDQTEGLSLGPLGLFWEAVWPRRTPDKTIDEVPPVFRLPSSSPHAACFAWS